jgi:prepilin-type processing-associated H-X9-DG protein
VKPGETIGSTTTRVAKRITVIKVPSDFFIVADSYWMAWGTQGYGISPGEQGDNRVRLDKTGMAGALFLDGHVERKPKAYFEGLGQTQGEYSDNQPFPTWSPARD